jgi:hypothetical protein
MRAFQFSKLSFATGLESASAMTHPSIGTTALLKVGIGFAYSHNNHRAKYRAAKVNHLQKELRYANVNHPPDGKSLAGLRWPLAA